MYTIEEAQEWANKNNQELDSKRLGHTDKMVQMMNRIMPEKSKSLWDSGCWLGTILQDLGANDEQIGDIQMAHGQRSFGGDSWKAAVDYANEFAECGDTEEKGGAELAEKRHKEIFG